VRRSISTTWYVLFYLLCSILSNTLCNST
jgi:hypothetical protein